MLMVSIMKLSVLCKKLNYADNLRQYSLILHEYGFTYLQIKPLWPGLMAILVIILVWKYFVED
jgi:hypothetical protein